MKPAYIGVIVLRGELELSRKGEIRSALQLSDEATSFLIDCSGVTYADSTALAELMRFHREADTKGVNVALLIGNRQFARLLEYAGLPAMFQVFEDRAAALTYLGTRPTT